MALFKQCLPKMKAVLAENHPETLATMSALAFAYKLQDKCIQDSSLLLVYLGYSLRSLPFVYPSSSSRLLQPQYFDFEHDKCVQGTSLLLMCVDYSLQAVISVCLDIA